MTTLCYIGSVTVAFPNLVVAPQQTFDVDDELADTYLRRSDVVEVIEPDTDSTSSLAKPVAPATVKQSTATVSENAEPVEPTTTAQEG